MKYLPCFFTATIYKWKHLLKPNKYKDIIIDSLTFLVAQNRLKVYAFVIMPNHIHLIWQAQGEHKPSDIQRDFLKYTAQKIKYDLEQNHPKVLEHFKVNVKDRKYQFWKYNPLSTEIWSKEVMLQKLSYIHNNPIKEKWKLSDTEEGYFYSSANFYQTGEKAWSFLSHFEG